MTENDIADKVKFLEEQKSQLQSELWRIKRKPESHIAYILLVLGLILLSLSLVHSHSISAYLGIALTFWGSLLLYVKPTKFIRKVILETSIEGFIRNIEDLLDHNNFKGIPVYLSPGLITGFRDVKIVIPKTDASQIPSEEQFSEESIMISNPPTIILSPPGLELSRLIEKELNINFSLINIDDSINYLEKFMVEIFEITKYFKMENKEPIIKVTMRETIYDKVIEQIMKKRTFKYIGDPLISSIACILALLTQQLITIQNIEIDTISNETIVTYEIRARN